MLLACYSHKHISYRIRTIIRKAITSTCLSSFRKLRSGFSGAIAIFPLSTCSKPEILR
ncbi:hypothetical protein [Wolbachia endosymbiont (group A) of Aleiodes leptofemur]|uniref:hypothetical protein n=1 Tax=Wolbachia endosymbiont (group A) of Aleiodes leptofemur TaxID=3077919 RepID=UPI003340D6BF